MNSTSLLYLGNVVKSHGIRGSILIIINNEEIKFTNDLKRVWLGENPNHISSWEIENLRRSNDKVFLKLRNVDTPEEASFLKGLKVYIQQDYLEEMTILDTVGFQLIDKKSGKILGIVEDYEKGAMQAMLVFSSGDEQHLMPAVDEFIKEVNWERREILVDLIEGLI